jgi:hypothetical protein
MGSRRKIQGKIALEDRDTATLFLMWELIPQSWGSIIKCRECPISKSNHALLGRTSSCGEPTKCR